MMFRPFALFLALCAATPAAAHVEIGPPVATVAGQADNRILPPPPAPEAWPMLASDFDDAGWSARLDTDGDLVADGFLAGDWSEWGLATLEATLELSAGLAPGQLAQEIRRCRNDSVSSCCSPDTTPWDPTLPPCCLYCGFDFQVGWNYVSCRAVCRGDCSAPCAPPGPRRQQRIGRRRMLERDRRCTPKSPRKTARTRA